MRVPTRSTREPEWAASPPISGGTGTSNYWLVLNSYTRVRLRHGGSICAWVAEASRSRTVRRPVLSGKTEGPFEVTVARFAAYVLCQLVRPPAVHSDALDALDSDQLDAYVIAAVSFVRGVNQFAGRGVQRSEEHTSEL